MTKKRRQSIIGRLETINKIVRWHFHVNFILKSDDEEFIEHLSFTAAVRIVVTF